MIFARLLKGRTVGFSGGLTGWRVLWVFVAFAASAVGAESVTADGAVAADTGAVRLRVVAANLTSGRHPSYAPDLGTNAEGAGARILKALRPDVVLIQEFNTDIPIDDWVRETFGDEFVFYCEDDAEIPNGVISRFPIVEAGEWDDPGISNRDFAWARLELPNGREMFVVSVHWHSKKTDVRGEAARILAERLGEFPAETLIVLGGDFNTQSANAPELRTLRPLFDPTAPQPVDQAGATGTNAKRSKPYDWVLPNAALAKFAVPVRVGDAEFPHGLVFDSRVFKPLPAPVLATDSGGFQMQHMAVVRDFVLPEQFSE